MSKELLNESNPSPTKLNLFHYQRAELGPVTRHAEQGAQLKKECSVANNAFRKLAEETNSRLGRIKEARQEFLDSEPDYMSCIAVGMAYLKMEKELSDKGLSPEQIMAFFSKCLKINCRISTFSHQMEKTHDRQYVLTDSLQRHGQLGHTMQSVIDQETGEPPAWFGTNRQNWKDFVKDHALFVIYLYPEAIKHLQLLNDPIESRKRPHLTLEHALPEWLTESEGTIPDQQVVVKELAEDREAYAKLVDQIFKITADANYLIKTAGEKQIRAVARFEERRRKLLSGVNSFAEAIIFLGSTADMKGYEVDLTKIHTMAASQVSKTVVSEEKNRLQAYGRFSQLPEVVLSKDTIALWLETELKKGRIIATVQETVTQEFIDLFNIVLNKSLETLRENSYHAFKALNYEIAPLLITLSADQQTYLRELLSEYKGGPIEPFLWEMADILSAELKSQDNTPLPQQTSPSINHLREFSIRWIRNNWTWAYQKLMLQLSAPRQMPTAETTEVETGSTETADEELKEVVTLTEDVQQGNLKGWRLFYTFDRRLDDTHLIEIGGLTEEEREANLRQFITRNTIPCSIKPESIMRSFEWLVAVPQQVENIRIRKEVNGEIFKKIKRGRIRIFYSMDDGNKRIIFFIHQKKADNYRF